MQQVMYGVGTDYDGVCFTDYDPWQHASSIGLPIIYRDDIPGIDVVAAYSEEFRAIFVRNGLSNAVEKCAIAHEIVHYEFADTGYKQFQEDRADRIAASRLIRESRLEEAFQTTHDLGRIALALGVTEKIMTIYMKKMMERR